MLTPNKPKPSERPRGSLTEFTQSQLVIAICISLVGALVCFCLGVVVGRYDRSFLRTPQAKRTEAGPASSSASRLPATIPVKEPSAPPKPAAEGVQKSPREVPVPTSDAKAAANAAPIRQDMRPAGPRVSEHPAPPKAGTPATPAPGDAAVATPPSPEGQPKMAEAVTPKTGEAPTQPAAAGPKTGEKTAMAAAVEPGKPPADTGTQKPDVSLSTTPASKTATAAPPPSTSDKPPAPAAVPASAKPAEKGAPPAETKDKQGAAPAATPKNEKNIDVAKAATVKPESKTAESTGAAPAGGKGNWVIQVASFSGPNRQKMAEDSKRRLKANANLDAEFLTLPGSDSVKVVVGSYPDRQTALNERNKLKDRPGFADCFVRQR